MQNSNQSIRKEKMQKNRKNSNAKIQTSMRKFVSSNKTNMYN